MKRFKMLSIILISALILLFFYRYQMLNKKYPNPDNEKYGTGESMLQGNFALTLQKAELIDGNALSKLAPNTIIACHSDGSAYNENEIRVLLAYIRVEKVKRCDDTYDFVPISSESGSWGNGLNIELFMKLNKGISVHEAEIEYNSAIEVVLPFSMVNTMFKNSEWEKIDFRKFFIVHSLYPVKKVMELTT